MFYSALKICFILAIVRLQATQAVTFECEYVTTSWPNTRNVYSCDVQSITADSNEDILTVTGNHYKGKGDSDVKFLNVALEINSIPKNVGNTFKKLKGVQFWYTGLKYISADDLKQFTKLEVLSFYGNELKILDDYLLTNNSKLKWIDFRNNSISYIGSNLLKNMDNIEKVFFSGNICIDRNAETAKAVKELVKLLPTLCSVQEANSNRSSTTTRPQTSTRSQSSTRSSTRASTALRSTTRNPTTTRSSTTARSSSRTPTTTRSSTTLPTTTSTIKQSTTKQVYSSSAPVVSTITVPEASTPELSTTVSNSTTDFMPTAEAQTTTTSFSTTSNQFTTNKETTTIQDCPATCSFLIDERFQDLEEKIFNHFVFKIDDLELEIKKLKEINESFNARLVEIEMTLREIGSWPF